MAERPKQTNGEPRRGGRAKTGRTGKSLHVYIPQKLWDALDALASRNKRPVTGEVELALEAHLTLAGLWPPPADAVE